MRSRIGGEGVKNEEKKRVNLMRKSKTGKINKRRYREITENKKRWESKNGRNKRRRKNENLIPKAKNGTEIKNV